MSGPWSRAQLYTVRAAILMVAQRNRLFTADDVWQALGPLFPVSKGLAAVMVNMALSGVIENTGATTRTRRPAGEHNRGQRVSVWRSKVYQGV